MRLLTRPRAAMPPRSLRPRFLITVSLTAATLLAAPLVLLWHTALTPIPRGGAFVQTVAGSPPPSGGVLVLYRTENPPYSIADLNDASPRVVTATGTIPSSGDAPITEAADTAWAVANEIAGTPVGFDTTLVVADVTPGSPADHAGVSVLDTVTSRTDTGTVVDTMAGPVPVTSGVELRTLVTLHDPRPALTAPSRLRGSSGGLANTLVFLDHLTIGSLTAGRLVAATGVVDLGGGVADIGSVELKTQAALAAGADVLFVPHHQIRAATTAADAYRPGNDLTVVGVASVIAAVRWLCTSGGEASGVCD